MIGRLEEFKVPKEWVSGEAEGELRDQAAGAEEYVTVPGVWQLKLDNGKIYPDPTSIGTGITEAFFKPV